MAEQLEDILTPVVAALGYEVWHLELEGAGSNRLLRLYIDAPGGITLEDCEAVSREVSATLDVVDPLPGAYRLEVSSPGLDRPLATRAHFERFVGAELRVTLYGPQDGRRRFKGRLQAVGEDALELDCEGTTVVLPRSAIAKARLVPEFDSPDS